jgi:predicted MPP superfamily phosphohydrolase
MVTWAIVLWSLVGILVGALAYGAVVGARDLRLERITVHLPGLPADLAGLRVLHLSDTHFIPGTFMQPVDEKMVAYSREVEPDIILLTGDLAAGSENLPLACEWLAKLSAPLGIFAVLGNHDLDVTMERWLLGLDTGGDPDTARGPLARSGVTLLHNEWAAVEARGRRLLIVGVGDASCGLDDIALALEDAPVDADLTILLSHSPDIFDRPGLERADLVLCGHTHAGQMMLPGIGPLWAPVWRGRRRGAGVLALGDVVAHVTRGVGATWPARLGAPPQVALLDLQPGPPDGLPVRPALHRPPSGLAASSAEVDRPS